MKKLIKRDGSVLCEFEANYDISIKALLEQIGSNEPEENCIIIESKEVID